MAGPQQPPQSRILLASGSPSAQDLPPKSRMWDQKETFFYQEEALGWLALNIHPPKVIRVPTSTQQKDAHDTHQTFKQIVFCQI